MSTLQRFTIIARLQEDVESYPLKVPMAISCRGNTYHTYHIYYTYIPHSAEGLTEKRISHKVRKKLKGEKVPQEVEYQFVSIPWKPCSYCVASFRGHSGTPKSLAPSH